jgi:cyclophilin family peptidyl-prolyl cis-trans isomerase
MSNYQDLLNIGTLHAERQMRVSRRTRRLSLSVAQLEQRLVMAAPALDPIANVQLPAAKTLMIPITASDADGDPLTYTVEGNNGDVLATVRTGHPFLNMSIQNYGDMVFQLFDDIAPTTVANITNLVDQGFYDGLTIHRIVKDFVVQGGDPNGNGSGGPGFKFDDEFSPEAIFSGTGQLAMANSGKDTNGSQFFVTTGPQRFLDFNHTIYGQLVRGFDVLAALNNSTVPPNIVISSMSVTTDVTDTVLQLEAPATGSTQFTVTVTDSTGLTDTQTFTATAITDTYNDPPFLGPVSNVNSYTNRQITIPLSSFDYENDAVVYAAAFGVNPAPGTFVVNGSNIVITPNTGYTGTFTFRVGVRQANAVNRGSTSDPFDIQDIQIRIANPFTTTAQTVTVNESQSTSSKRLATFVPAYPKDASAYVASIDWGGGVTTAGTVTKLADGSFEVRGDHAFSQFGTYPVSVTVSEPVDQISTVINSTVIVNDAPISASFVTPSRDPGSGLIVSQVIATITDSNVEGLASDLTAQIAWGDGSTSAGVIIAGDGVFNVSASKTYSAFGNFTVTVSVTSSGGQTAQAQGTISVANAQPVITPIGNQSVQEGEALTVPVSATDSDTWQTLTYSLGANTPAGVSINGQTGLISVATSVAAGNYAIDVRVDDNGVPARSATSSFQLEVVGLVTNEPPVISWKATPPTSVLNSEDYVLSGDVTDVIGAGVLGAVVDYGDGGGYVGLPLAADGSFTLSHRYTKPGSYMIRVRGVDQAGLASEAQTSVTVINPVTQVSSAEVIRGRNNQISGFRIYFSGGLNSSSAGRLQNYQIVNNPGRDRTFGTRDDRLTRIQTVRYEPTTNSVLVIPRGRLSLRGSQFIRLRISGLLDSSNTALDGNRDGTAGGDAWLNVTATGISII